MNIWSLNKQTVQIITILLVSSLCIQCSNQKKADSENPYLLLLSLDGFRWDYNEKAHTPNLDFIAKNGVRSNIIPSFPTKTFPNHYSIATGLYPENHGILLNNFHSYKLNKTFSMRDRGALLNPEFYKGEPIWNTAEKQGLKTASYFWVGSAVKIQGMQPTYWKNYIHEFPFTNIIDTVIFWLSLEEQNRPHLICFYFNQPDEIGHQNGPDSPDVIAKIEYLDSLVGDLLQKISKLDYAANINLIITSDHGMSHVPPENKIYLDSFILKDWISSINGGSPVSLIKANEGFKDSIYQHLKKATHLNVWYPYEVPSNLHFSTNINIQDIVICADSSYHIAWKTDNNDFPIGSHGYPNTNTDMHAIFYAIGPAFKQNYTHVPFENVNLYPLMAKILNLEAAQVDGNIEVVKNMLID